MNLTSEQVHWLFGGALVVAAVLLILRGNQRIASRWLDYVTPGLLLLFGIELLLDPLVHGSAVPANYAAETAQHFAFGLVLIAAAGGEMVRVRRDGDGWAWRLPLAVALLTGAGVFAFHAQHDSQVPMILLVAQHRVIAATLLLSALAFVIAPPRRDEGRPSAFAFLVLLLGLELLLYTEGTSLFGETLDMHNMAGMR